MGNGKEDKMTTNVIVKLDEDEIERIVEGLPLRLKLRLVRNLEEATRKERWDTLFKRIDERFRKHPVTAKEIDEEIAAVRKAKYAQSRS